MRWKVVLEPISPIVLGEGLATGNFQTTHSVIGGGVWRGSLAQLVLDLVSPGRSPSVSPHTNGSTTNADFRTVFLERDAARFGFLYFAGEKAGLLQQSLFDALPIPLSARTCKRRGGFESDGGHGIWDLTLSGIRTSLNSNSSGVSSEACRSPNCGERLERVRGVMVRSSPRVSGNYAKVSVSPHPLVRVGLNRHTETAEAEVLYALEAIVPPKPGHNVAIGNCYLSDSQFQALVNLLGSIPGFENHGNRLSWTMRVGTARARGLGKVRVVMEKLPSANGSDTSLEALLEEFQPKLGNQKLDPSHYYFSILLRSPAILRDAQNNLVSLPDRESLGRYLPANENFSSVLSSLEPISGACAVETTVLSGWKQAWGLPKPVRPAVAAGSVWTYRVPTAQRNALIPLLQYFDEYGIGENRAEGLGEVSICDPFHVTFDAERRN